MLHCRREHLIKAVDQTCSDASVFGLSLACTDKTTSSVTTRTSVNSLPLSLRTGLRKTALPGKARRSSATTSRS